MNDFSKEELQLILKGMSQYYLEKDSLELMDKIQSMIDNYCEHENKFYENGLKAICFKCNKEVINDNQ